MLDQTLSKLSTEMPGATAIFNKHQLNFCCGGSHTLRDAISKKGLATSEILSELSALSKQVKPLDALNALSSSDLIEHILIRYHDTHRKQLAELVRLASRVEKVHGDLPACPNGLAEHLDTMRQELEQHMHKEEQILFPMLQQGMNAMAQGPISMMRHEHEGHSSAVSQIIDLTNNLALPIDACNTWRALYLSLDEFMTDLHNHIEIENTILFNRT